jgi:hypothetical protein
VRQGLLDFAQFQEMASEKVVLRASIAYDMLFCTKAKQATY